MSELLVLYHFAKVNINFIVSEAMDFIDIACGWDAW